MFIINYLKSVGFANLLVRQSTFFLSFCLLIGSLSAKIQKGKICHWSYSHGKKLNLADRNQLNTLSKIFSFSRSVNKAVKSVSIGMDLLSPWPFVIYLADRRLVLQLSSQGPVVVHCSAGVGRTGTFIAVHKLYRELISSKVGRI